MNGDENVKENTVESKLYSSKTIAYGMYVDQYWNTELSKNFLNLRRIKYCYQGRQSLFGLGGPGCKAPHLAFLGGGGASFLGERFYAITLNLISM